MKQRKNKRLTTREQDKFILENYKGISSQELTELVNAKFGTKFVMSQMQNYKSRNNLRSDYCAEFKKGRTPMNKGKTWDEYMSKEGQINSRKTTFKKGNIPHNHKPVGSERICSKDGYVLVKTKEPRTWESKHRVLWKQHNGEIPKGHKIVFLNQNKFDIRIENLIMVSDEENGIMRGWNLHDSNPEITKTGSLMAKLHQKVNDLEKGNHD